MAKDLRVLGIYGSGMVLQRDKINCIYGSGDVFSDVIMSFRGVTSITQVDENGNWKFEFSPGEAGGPFEMSIKCDNQKIDFTDIYVGEVWLNAGEGNAKQSMDSMKYTYPEEFELPDNLNVRMLNIPINYSFSEKINYVENPKWNYVTKDTLGEMSGVGYFFAKKLSVDLGVPVGIINASFEDAPIVSWLSRKAIEEMGDKKEDLEVLSYYEDKSNLEKEEKKKDELIEWNSEFEKSIPEIDFDNSDGWSTCTIPGLIKGFDSNGIIWLKKEIELTSEQIENFVSSSTESSGGLSAVDEENRENGFANLWLGTINSPDEVFFNGKRVGATSDVKKPRRFKVSTDLLKTGKNILLIKLQKNEKEIVFQEEKPYRLFSNNVYVAPCVTRNLGGKDQSLAPFDGEDIELEGEWQMKVGAIRGNAPEIKTLHSKPTAIYRGVLPSCFKYAMAGVLWFQGMSDLGRAKEYKGFLSKLITLWRRRFTFWSRDLPFIIVQLPSWGNGKKEGELSINSNLSLIRKAQEEVSKGLDKVGLVVSIDAGEWNDMYAEKKATIGTRCEFEALRMAYGKNYISAAPTFIDYERKCENDETKFLVHFNCGNSSLHSFNISDTNPNEAILCKECDNGKVYGFTFLYMDMKGCESIEKADAKIINANTIEVTLPSICKDREVKELRYLYADCPSPINLYSRDMLPATPFVVQL